MLPLKVEVRMRKPRWIQNQEARQRARSESLELRSIIRRCADPQRHGGLDPRFPTLKLHHSLDSRRIVNMIADELRMSEKAAESLYAHLIATWDEEHKTR